MQTTGATGCTVVHAIASAHFIRPMLLQLMSHAVLAATREQLGLLYDGVIYTYTVGPSYGPWSASTSTENWGLT